MESMGNNYAWIMHSDQAGYTAALPKPPKPHRQEDDGRGEDGLDDASRRERERLAVTALLAVPVLVLVLVLVLSMVPALQFRNWQ